MKITPCFFFELQNEQAAELLANAFFINCGQFCVRIIVLYLSDGIVEPSDLFRTIYTFRAVCLPRWLDDYAEK